MKLLLAEANVMCYAYIVWFVLLHIVFMFALMLNMLHILLCVSVLLLHYYESNSTYLIMFSQLSFCFVLFFNLLLKNQLHY